MLQRFTFEVSGDTLVGNFYIPEGKSRGTVVLTGPLTSVKEQASGAYAAALAKEGFSALAFDHRYFGESGGNPRQYENPQQKISDIQSAVSAVRKACPDQSVFAVGVCAGGGYMAGAVAETPEIKAFAGVAGFYHDVAQSKEWMGDSYASTIAQGQAARHNFEETGELATIPAVASDGDRAMPMNEAYEYYGTARGGEETFSNYSNEYAVMSKEKVTTFDVQMQASKISVPTLILHSENALSPLLARRFFKNLAASKEQEWVSSKGQIDFYDDPRLIKSTVKRIADFFEASDAD